MVHVDEQVGDGYPEWSIISFKWNFYVSTKQLLNGNNENCQCTRGVSCLFEQI